MSAEGEQAPPQLIALTWLVFAEAAVLAGAAGFLTFELFSADAQDLRSALALTISTAIFAVGVIVLGIGLQRRWARIRGGVLLWQLLQVACAIGAFQGLLGPDWIGWLLFVPAVAGIWLLFTKPVTAVFAAKDAETRG